MATRKASLFGWSLHVFTKPKLFRFLRWRIVRRSIAHFIEGRKRGELQLPFALFHIHLTGTANEIYSGSVRCGENITTSRIVKAYREGIRIIFVTEYGNEYVTFLDECRVDGIYFTSSCKLPNTVFCTPR